MPLLEATYIGPRNPVCKCILSEEKGALFEAHSSAKGQSTQASNCQRLDQQGIVLPERSIGAHMTITDHTGALENHFGPARKGRKE